jgi:thymidylate synthase (FAD)
MKIIPASYKILAIYPNKPLEFLEKAGRTCYKSEDLIGPGTAKAFVLMVLKRGHESVIEHAGMSVRFVYDRGVSHEKVRQRIASFSQESTRFCNYSKDKFGKEITVIDPVFWLHGSDCWNVWEEACTAAETYYFKLIELGAKPEEARTVLPNSLKTEIVVTANLREWRHIFKLRCASKAHPQMREVMVPLLEETRRAIPVLFDEPWETT